MGKSGFGFEVSFVVVEVDMMSGLSCCLPERKRGLSDGKWRLSEGKWRLFIEKFFTETSDFPESLGEILNQEFALGGVWVIRIRHKNKMSR